LTGEASAIVTDIPGTTRDALEEVITIKGVPLRLVDTAGLRHSEDVVEKIGIERTLAHVETADVVLFLVDGTKPLSPEEIEKIAEVRSRDIPVVVAGNKSDLLHKETKTEHIDLMISAKTGKGMSALETKLLRIAGWRERADVTSPLLMELRHKEKLLAAQASLLRVSEAVREGRAPDLVSIDVKAAVVALGEITGETVTSEMIDHIFENFCVGK
jgi:tRNA modification GTPase